MKQQSYSNHARLSAGYHGLTFGLILVFLGASIHHFVRDETTDKYGAALMILLAVILILVFFFARVMPLKAQDRAIRAEEGLRYYQLTGTRLDPALRMGQIIALRFAPDEELPGLAERAAREKLSGKGIKMAIRDWKADHHRV